MRKNKPDLRGRSLPRSPPGLVDGKYSVYDLVDLDRLRIILQRFSDATGFTTGFVAHPSMEILISTGWRDICTRFHRRCPDAARYCKESNEHLTKQLRRLNAINIKPCGNGLVDGATPVVVNGVHIASLATGQVFTAPPDLERFRRQAKQFGFNETAYLKAVRQVPIVSTTRLRQALLFLSELAVVIAELGCQKLQAEDQSRRLRSLAAQVVSAQDLEQRRIANGLHDDVAQILASCSMKLGVVPDSDSSAKLRSRCEVIQQLLQTANDKIRSLSFELSSSTLHHLGLRKAIEELCDSFVERYDISFKIYGRTVLSKLDTATATILFKAVRELLFNVVKHAGVKSASVHIGMKGRFLVIAVEDLGKGFSARTMRIKRSPAKGLGLFGIEERLRDLNGELHIESEPNVRTRVTLKVPVHMRGRERSSRR